MSVICLPYVTFNDWHVHTRRIIIAVFITLVIISLALFIFLFYILQPQGIGTRNSNHCIIENECHSENTLLDLI